jgi:AraC-like DNA-binding protein
MPTKSTYVTYLPSTLKYHHFKACFKLRPVQFRQNSILFVTGGLGHLSMNEDWHDLKAGSCFLWQASTRVQLVADSQNSLQVYFLQYLSIPLDVRNLATNCILTETPDMGLHYSKVVLPSLAFIESLLGQLITTLHNPSPQAYFKKISLFHEILQVLSETTEDDRLPPSIRRTILYMERYYTKAIQVGNLPVMAGLTPNSFCRAFKKATGFTPSRYLTRLRMNRAKQLLMMPELSLKEIATHVGFQDELYFSRVFKNVVGVSPTIFMKENMN